MSIKSPTKSPLKKSPKKLLSSKQNKAHRKLNFNTSNLEEVQARLHSKQLPENMWTREVECDQIRKFILASLYAKKRGGNANSVYIAGVPGTGKTACVLKVCFILFY